MCAPRSLPPMQTPPKGSIDSGGRRYQIYTNDQARDGAQYRSLVIASRDGSVVRLSDVGHVVDSVEDLRNQGLANGKPAVLVILYRQPGANIVATADRVKALLPRLRASIPSDIDVTINVNILRLKVSVGIMRIPPVRELRLGMTLCLATFFEADRFTCPFPTERRSFN
jgi:AcrB/AcrD/AcrF family